MKIFWDPRSVIEHQDYSGPANVFHLLFTSLPTMSAETAAANTATAPVPEVQEQESSKSKQVNLTPAPLPTSSPWKLAPTEIPVSTISIEDLDATRRRRTEHPLRNHRLLPSGFPSRPPLPSLAPKDPVPRMVQVMATATRAKTTKLQHRRHRRVMLTGKRSITNIMLRSNNKWRKMALNRQ